MSSFIIYMLQVNVSLVITVVLYYVVLRRLTFFMLNRWFLMTTIVVSVLWPYVMEQLPTVSANTQLGKMVYTLNIPWQQIGNATASITWSDVLQVMYYIGVGIMTILFVVQCISLRNIHVNAVPHESDMQVRWSNNIESPFSFLNTIYINPNLHTTNDIKAIIAHERIHISQWHTLDVIVAELIKIFFWVNPGAWLMKLAVLENLEFIVDQKMLHMGTNKKQYQYQLLKAVTAKNIFRNTIVNRFSILQLKKRITMMNKQKSLSITKWRYAIVVPLVTGISILFARQPNTAISKTNTVIAKVLQDTVPAKSSYNVKYVKTNTAWYGEVYDNSGKLLDKINFNTASKIAKENWEKKYGVIPPSPPPPPPPPPPMSTSMPPPPPPMPKASTEQVHVTLKPIEGVVKEVTYVKKNESVQQDKQGLQITANTLFVVNGVVVEKTELSNISPDRISAINVIKGDKAVATYGNKVKGKEGVIEITLK
jgi:beta-lactamase regulating signal transducer with metallopeptidase domain